ncbi:serine/threonine protein kinase [Leptolyngbya sp. FACHB-671]|uniref:serine/threonine protein kinase n=1 Tax=Leptolyngbya sp. FACHB-671 TaxID=2692812 RepID=UPI001687E4E3|nr:serine/threonine-protein kinase [Leptolyngbya sp. FACHB-671]MBD2067366.1 serine/threonine protein kinase [Leptolyngbya sp. FACHB-671]
MDNTSGLLQQRYEIQRQLGKNAGRQTLLAYDRQENQQVVIKLLTFDRDFEWDALKLFEREAETLKALSHPSIPRYLDFFEIDLPDAKQFALIQSYVKGRSLDHVLKAGHTFSEAEIKQLVKSLLEILKYLHGRKPPVIHRDIKPSNIILGDRTGNSSNNRIKQVYLVDFGSVQTLATQEGRTVTVVGTYGYMPPEQFGGRAVPASDLYGVGATAIALATRKHPADLPQKNLRIQFEPFAHLSPAFAVWLKQTTEPTLKGRFASAQVALAALKQSKHHNDVPVLEGRAIGTSKLIVNALLQSSKTGLVAGSLLGAYFGTGILPLVGTFVGFVIGGFVGIGLGMLNGLLLGILTRLYFYPLKRARRYQRFVRNTSTLAIAASTLALILGLIPTVPGSYILFLSVVAVPVIAGLAAGLASRDFARWYQRESL